MTQALAPTPRHSLFSVALDVHDGRLVCRVEPATEDSGLKFSFQLRRNGQVISEPVFLPVRETDWELTESGLYWVNVWANIPHTPSVSSRYIQYFTPAVEDAYSSWLADDGGRDIPALPVRRATAPFQDLAVVLLTGSDPDGRRIDELTETSGLVSQMVAESPDGEIHFLTRDGVPIDGQGRLWAFSGLARHRDTLIVGEAECRRLIDDAGELSEAVGDFTLLRWDGRQAVLEADYFGLGRIFVREAPEAVVASNSYHLLLRLCRSLGLPMELDIEKTIAGFFDSGPFFQANFSHRMDVAGCRQLRVDERFLLSPSGPASAPTGLNVDLRRAEPFDPNHYERLLFAARDEIVDNVRAALKHTPAGQVRIDLTGGTDSRLVFSAITDLPRTETAACRIYYEDAGNSEAGEPVIVEMINSLYGFPWDIAPHEVEAQDPDPAVLYESPHSAYLGTYYAHEDYKNSSTTPRGLVLSGGMGEACAKAEMRYWFPEAPTATEVVNRFIHSRGDSLVSFASADCFRRVAMESLSEMPGRSDTERVDNLYVYFRSGTHYSARNQTSTLSWKPLMSKASMRAKYLRFARDVDRKVGFDLQNLMNPLLATIPFANAQKNRQREELHAELYDGAILCAKLPLHDLADGVRESANVRRLATVYVPDESTYRARLHRQEELLGDEETHLSALRAIIRAVPEFDQVGLAVYHFLVSGRAANVRFARQSIRNRILSTYYQLELCRPPQDQEPPTSRK